MSEPFVIVGAGGLGREIVGWIAGCTPEKRRRFNVTAFVTESQDVGATAHGLPVQSIDSWRSRRPRYLIAIADPVEKKRIAELLASFCWTPETLIHDSAAVGLAAKIGPGTIICPFCRISSDSRIGGHVLVNGASGVGHDAVVGDYCSLLGSVSVNGNVQLGEGVLLGAGSTVYPGKKVGAWARVGMGSVVIQSVKPGEAVFGNPARVI